jgi:integrase
VGIPQSIVPILREHRDTYVQDGPGALMFPAAKGGPMRRSGFNTRTRWVDVVTETGLPGLHFHDLRHTGNMLAAESGAGLKDLMARMGHGNVRAAMIYQHAVRGADEAITNAIDRQLEARDDDDDEGTAGALVPAGGSRANGPRRSNHFGNNQGSGRDSCPHLGLRDESG